MPDYIKIKCFSDLNDALFEQYKSSVYSSFPKVIFQSEVVKHCWPSIEKYFPEFQLFLVDDNERLIGFINTMPIFWDRPIDDLPDDGWDWLVKKGIVGFENGIKPNCLGGLQIIVAKDQLGKGYSKILIAEGKKLMERFGFENFIIPIRPTFKSKYPEMKMDDYINFKPEGKTYDPWIRTHLSSGAEIIKVCYNAMNITGDISYWEDLMSQKIIKTGNYIVDGALNPVRMNLENDIGEYREANIWINYSAV